MTETSKTPSTPQEAKRPRRRARGPKIALEDIDAEARKVAVAILEVLAGVRSPTEAAESLGVSATRYYALESRALSGLISACRRRPRGPGRNAERECARLRRELERVGRECARLQALVRLSQRTVGIARVSEKPKKSGPKKRRRRRPTARALRAVESLRPRGDEKTLAEGTGRGDDLLERSPPSGRGVSPAAHEGP